MSKFYPSRLKAEEQNELILDFCYVIASLPTLEKAAQFIKDLLSPQEAEMLSKRVKIAHLLIDGWKYSEIQPILKTGPGTIARVHEWLKYSGEGYRESATILKKRNKEKASLGKNRYTMWETMKRKYPLQFWPLLLLDQIAEAANAKQREKLHSIINTMWKKKEIFSEADQKYLSQIQQKLIEKYRTKRKT